LQESQAERQIILRDELAETRQAFAVAQKQFQEAEGRLRVLLAGSRPEEIQASQAEIARLDVQWRYLDEQLGRVKVVSPISGVVTTHKLKEKIGQHVNRGDLIAKVFEVKTVTAEIDIPEKEVADIKVGQSVLVKARAYPERSFHGKVSAVAPTASKEDLQGAGRTILVTTQLDNDSQLLKPEMTGNAKVYCGKRVIFNLLTRRFSRYVRVEFWSWW
jgi:multidrug efflux pump subunit AcrA (membrane-fusion protein)